MINRQPMLTKILLKFCFIFIFCYPSISVANECLRIDPENLDGHILLCTDYVLSSSVDDARRVAEEILRIQPSFSISAYVETQPYKDPQALEQVITMLQEAGLH